VGAAQRLPIDVVGIEVEERLNAARSQAGKLNESLVEDGRLACCGAEHRAIGEIEAAEIFASAQRASGGA
jgi:hypothetical protein